MPADIQYNRDKVPIKRIGLDRQEALARLAGYGRYDNGVDG
jgi:hypothetical protein